MRHKQYLKNSIQKLNNLDRFDTSLMIPMKFLEIVKTKTDYHRSMRNFLHYLIIRHGSNLQIKSNLRQNVLTKYQEKGQSLTKCNFMPESRDWLTLKEMAFHLGVSISYLFIILLKFELSILKKAQNNLNSKSRVPVKFPIFSLLSHLEFGKNNQYLLFSRFKID